MSSVSSSARSDATDDAPLHAHAGMPCSGRLCRMLVTQAARRGHRIVSCGCRCRRCRRRRLLRVRLVVRPVSRLPPAALPRQSHSPSSPAARLLMAERNVAAASLVSKPSRLLPNPATASSSHASTADAYKRCFHPSQQTAPPQPTPTVPATTQPLLRVTIWATCAADSTRLSQE